MGAYSRWAINRITPLLSFLTRHKCPVSIYPVRNGRNAMYVFKDLYRFRVLLSLF